MQWRDELLRRFPRLELIPGGSYVVGGAIRDLLLGREPADVDVAATEPLRIAERIGQRVIRLGGAEDLSAYRVVEGGHVYDVAPLLEDDIVRDLARRDFTVNAMAVELATGELLDHHQGQQDLARRVVRMVRAENFDDDPLRMLKAVRMAVRHDFVIDPATIEAIRPRAGAIVSVAAERVSYELSLIFEQRQLRKAVALLAEIGLDMPLFGYEIKVAPASAGDSTSRYEADDVSLAGSLAILVRDPRAFARRWRLSEVVHRQIVALQQLLERNDPIDLYDGGEDVSRQLPGMLRALGRNEDAARVEDAMRGSLFAIRPLLTGEDISAATGLAPGPAVGHLKRKVLEAQIRGEVRTREEAERLIRKMKLN